MGGPRTILDYELYCPLSGAKWSEGKQIPPHKIAVVRCANGSLYAYCGTHGTRTFIADPTTVRTIMSISTVLGVTMKKSEAQNVT